MSYMLDMTDEELLESVCVAAYGPRWHRALASAVGVNERTVQRWATGINPVPLGVWGDILSVLAGRGKEISEAVDLIRREKIVTKESGQ